jgi:hypothetical protein
VANAVRIEDEEEEVYEEKEEVEQVDEEKEKMEEVEEEEVEEENEEDEEEVDEEGEEGEEEMEEEVNEEEVLRPTKYHPRTSGCQFTGQYLIEVKIISFSRPHTQLSDELLFTSNRHYLGNWQPEARR